MPSPFTILYKVKVRDRKAELLLMLLEAKQKVEDVALLDGPACVGALGGWGIGGEPDLDQGARAASIRLLILLRELVHCILARLLHLPMKTSQEALHVPSPALLIWLVRKGQFARIMGHAERMETGIVQDPCSRYHALPSLERWAGCS